MSEDVEVPTTVEEFQMAQREAFFAGADYILSTGPIREATWSDRIHVQQRRRYPIRKQVPRVAFNPRSGREYRVSGGMLQVKSEGLEWSDMVLSEDFVRDLLARPFDIVEE